MSDEQLAMLDVCECPACRRVGMWSGIPYPGHLVRCNSCTFHIGFGSLIGCTPLARRDDGGYNLDDPLTVWIDP